MLYFIYQNILRLMKPFVIMGLYYQVMKRGISFARFGEFRGIATKARTDGTDYVWVHSVSFGETKAAITLIKHMHVHHPALRFVLTTVTKTGADEVVRANLSCVVHQYLPFDHQTWVKRFFDAWKPICGVIVEQELWPCLYVEAHRKDIPLVIVNGHMTAESGAKWRKVEGLLQPILSTVRVVLAQSESDADQWRALGHGHVVNAGNLKFSSPALSYDASLHHELTTGLKDRTVWVAASMHKGEEEILAEVHGILAKEFSDLLTIIAPRHLEKTPDFRRAMESVGGRVALRSKDAPLTDDVNVYIADTLGEMGLWYSLSPLTLLGGSLIPGIGGHNPVEPIQLDCAVVTGMNTENIHDLVGEMIDAGALRQAGSAKDIARAIGTLLRKPVQLKALTQNGQRFINKSNPLDEIYATLRPFLMNDSSHLKDVN